MVAGADRASAARAGRDNAIDIIRGICIAAMIISHVAPGSTLFSVTHPLPWLDGASGFFLLAGIVLGLVHSRASSRGLWRETLARIWRRAGLLYALQVALTLAAVAVTAVAVHSTTWTAQVSRIGSAGEGAARAFVLGLNPDGLDILSSYVLIFLLLPAAFAVRRRGLIWPVALVSGAIYLAGLAAPDLLTLPRGDGQEAYFNWSAWQALFFSGYLVGWVWRDRELAKRLTSHRGGAVAASACALLIALALVLRHADAAEWLFDKSNCGPGRLALAWAAFALGYYLLAQMPLATRVRGAVAMLGRKSLQSFVLMSVVIVVLPLAADVDGDSFAAQALAAATVAAALLLAASLEQWKAVAEVRKKRTLEEEYLAGGAGFKAVDLVVVAVLSPILIPLGKILARLPRRD